MKNLKRDQLLRESYLKIKNNIINDLIKSSEKNVVKIFKTDNEDKNSENVAIYGFIWQFFRTIGVKLKQRTINKLDKKYT